MSVSEKIQFGFTCFFILASLILIMVWGMFIRRKMHEYKLLELRVKEREIGQSEDIDVDIEVKDKDNGINESLSEKEIEQ